MITRTLTFAHRGTTFDLKLPAEPEALIDRASFEADQRMPYWADLWPAALGLAQHLLDAEALEDRAIELGCGVGLVALVLVRRGVKVVATDYESEALEHVVRNAEANGLPAPRTALLDWRKPAGVAPAPLVVAADVLYEARHVDPLANCLDRLVATDGRALIADPGRAQRDPMIATMRARGWTAVEIDSRKVQTPNASVLGNPKPSTVGIWEFGRKDE